MRQKENDYILCDENGNNQYNLLQLIRSLHEGLAYVFNKYDLTETQLDNIPYHIQTLHRGKKYFEIKAIIK